MRLPFWIAVVLTMWGACRSHNTPDGTADRQPLSAPTGIGRTAARSSPALREERRRVGLEPKRCADRDHRRAAGVDGVDDLGVVDPLKVDRGDTEVAVAELALDDDERHAFA